MVLALAMTEGTANDWLAVALVDGHDVSHAVGVAGFAVFVLAMTAGRFAGTGLIDRFGRVAVLWGTMALAGAGVLLIVLAEQPALVVVGIVLWGVGASLGFPVGMSAAADDPVRAASRVSVVSTIGYAAFLAGPPLLGFVGDEVGTLKALLVVAVLLMPAALVVPAAREQRGVAVRPAGRLGPTGLSPALVDVHRGVRGGLGLGDGPRALQRGGADAGRQAGGGQLGADPVGVDGDLRRRGLGAQDPELVAAEPAPPRRSGARTRARPRRPGGAWRRRRRDRRGR